MPMTAPKQGMERIGRRLKLRDLRILMTVVECGTMGKAAARLAVSQPVVASRGRGVFGRNPFPRCLARGHWAE